MDQQGPYVAGIWPPIVWSSPTKYYPATASRQAAGSALSVQQSRSGNVAPADVHSSRALLTLSDKLTRATAAHKQQLADADASFQQQQTAAAAKIDRLQGQLAEQLLQQQQQQLLCSCVSAWRRLPLSRHRAAQQRQLLSSYWQAWQQVAEYHRQARLDLQATALHCWLVQARRKAAAASHCQLLQHRRLRKLLQCWLQLSTTQQEQQGQALIWAGRWRKRKVLHVAFAGWISQCIHKCQLAEGFCCYHEQQLVHKSIKAWHTLVQQHQELQHQQEQQQRQQQEHQNKQRDRDLTQQHQVWKAWRHQASLSSQQPCLHYLSNLLKRSWSVWLRLPNTNLRLRAIAAAIAGTYRQMLLQWGWQGLQTSCWEARDSRLAACTCLAAWLAVAARLAGQRRILRARAVARRQQALKQCVMGWWRVACRAAQHADAVRASELQVACTASDAKLQAALSAVEQLAQHNQQLQLQLQATCRAAVKELPLAPTLTWQYLPGMEGFTLLQPRARHATILLQALQPATAALHSSQGLAPAPGPCTTAQQPGYSIMRGHQGCSTSTSEAAPAGLLGCLVVFGGVLQDGSWLTDVVMLAVTDDDDGNCCIVTASVPCCSGTISSSSCYCHGIGGPVSHSEQSGVAGRFPLAVRDFAACPCGPSAFVVAGGFDGNKETLQLQVCVLWQMDLAETATAATEACSRARVAAVGHSSPAFAHVATTAQSPSAAAEGTPTTNNSECMQHATDTATRMATHTAAPSGTCHSDMSRWASSWQADWQLLQARTQVPVGRCHHSCCWHAVSNSLVVFGGWASRLGCLNDVQVFNLGHLEWWQPRSSGRSWPRPRRSHAAVILHNKLWIHGGLDNGQHLDDFWQLDLTTWEWQQLSPTGCDLCPAARRAHCLEAVQDRFLLLHGGYSGSSQIMQDTWAFDTHVSRWLAVEVEAAASEQPMARALHTLTCCSQRIFVVGGHGSFGPLGTAGMLCCPAVLHSSQLQQQQARTQAALLSMQQCCSQLQAELRSCQAKLGHTEHVIKDLSQQAVQYETGQASLTHENSMLYQHLTQSKVATAAAKAQAETAKEEVATLQRRLERARQGGSKALRVAFEASERLQSVDALVLQHQSGRTQHGAKPSDGMRLAAVCGT